MYLYDEVHAAYYDLTSTGLVGDVEFYVDEATRTGGPVLELGAGTGRTLIPIAEAGVEIVGLDNSSAMLAVAREKISALSEQAQSRIRLVEGDMRSFSLDQKFKLVTIPFRAFQHILTPEDQRAALKCIREHMVDNGKLIFNTFDVRFHTVAEHMGTLGGAVKKLKEFSHPDTGNRVIVWDTRSYDVENQLVEQDFIYEELDAQGKAVDRIYNKLSLRWAYRYEMQYLLELCGFKVEALYGDCMRGTFKYGGEQVWIVRKS
ncbi:MAG: class I SAM-dependent methyltransferase [Armatimonadota bacterium]